MSFSVKRQESSVKSSARMHVRGGFTLIELLVVIAIIGLLSSIVFASLNSARGKGGDAGVKQNLANIRSQAELVFDNDNGSYDNVCSNSIVDGMVKAANAAGGGTGLCTDDSDEWAASAKLKADTSKYWCVDYLGTSKQTSSAHGTVSGSIKCT